MNSCPAFPKGVLLLLEERIKCGPVLGSSKDAVEYPVKIAPVNCATTKGNVGVSDKSPTM